MAHLVLRDSRRAARLSQASLAKAAGTSQSAIARYERGHVEPGVETLERLVEACGRRLDLRTRPRFTGPVGRVLEDRRVRVLECCARHGATNVEVFGSVARGQDAPGSDVDLLVELEPGRTLLDLERLEIELTDILGVSVDVGTAEILRGGVSETVAADLARL